MDLKELVKIGLVVNIEVWDDGIKSFWGTITGIVVPFPLYPPQEETK